MQSSRSAFVTRGQKVISVESCERTAARRETLLFGRTPEMVPEVLRLRGGAGGDEEKNGCVKLVGEYLRPRETLTCI